MYKETITWEDFDGNERTEDFYFHLSKNEIAKMELRTPGGLEGLIRKMINEKDQQRLVDWFNEFIDLTYGVKSADGKKFMKSKELTEDFKQTGAYDQFYMRLVTDADYAANFINHALPSDLVEKAKGQLNQ